MVGLKEKKIVIRLPRKDLNGSKSASEILNYDFELYWISLSDAIIQVHNKNKNNLSYEQLYRKSYQIVINKESEKLYLRIEKLLIEVVNSLLTSTIADIFDDDLFFSVIVEKWKEFSNAMKYIDNIFMYLNRIYVKESNKLTVYDLGMDWLKKAILVFCNLREENKIQKYVISKINDEREYGNICKNNILKDVIQNFLKLEQENKIDHDELSVYYKLDFELVFESKSLIFYNNFVEKFSEDINIFDYLLLIHKFIEEEEERLSFYFEFTYKNKIVVALNEILIENIIKNVIISPKEKNGLEFWIFSDMTGFLKSRKTSFFFKELGILYNLVNKIPVKINLFSSKLSSVIYNKLEMLFSLLINRFNDLKKPKILAAFTLSFINLIYKFKLNLEKILKLSFNNDISILEALFCTLRNFLNGNLFENTDFRLSISEIFSLYLNLKIKKLKKSPISTLHSSSSNFTDNLDDIIETYIHLINDKNSFEKSFSENYAKRFFKSSFIAHNTENLEYHIIRKIHTLLKLNSFEKVLKMQNDIISSIHFSSEWNLLRTFVDHQFDSTQLEFKLCGKNNWPNFLTKNSFLEMSAKKSDQNLLPKNFTSLLIHFEDFWSSHKSNKKKTLVWSLDLSSMVLILALSNRLYELTLPLYSALILLLFNNKSSGNSIPLIVLSYKQIKESINIPDNILKKYLLSISMVPEKQILIKNSTSNFINDDDSFELNEKFKSTSYKINCFPI